MGRGASSTSLSLSRSRAALCSWWWPARSWGQRDGIAGRIENRVTLNIFWNRVITMRKKLFWFASLVLLASTAARSQAAYHLWEIQEIYTNSSGDLQFIELFDSASFDYFTKDQQFFVSNADFTQTHTFT